MQKAYKTLNHNTAQTLFREGEAENTIPSNDLAGVTLRSKNRAIITVSCSLNENTHIGIIQEIQQSINARFGFLTNVIVRDAIPLLIFNYRAKVRGLSDGFDTANYMSYEVKSIVDDCLSREQNILVNTSSGKQLVSIQN